MTTQPTLVCLHGWGGSKESFTELRAALEGSGIEVLTPDLPGFGDEPEPEKAWTVDDYADWVENWLQAEGRRQKVENMLLLGHSHGGRIAIKLITRHPTPYALRPTHLFLCAAAGIKRPKHIKRMIGLTLAKTGKFFLSIPGLNKLQPLGKKLLYKLVRVHDYEKASPIMRQTLINITKEDLRPILKQIALPTDIFWGKDDTMTPYKDALVMHEDIKGSLLHSYPGVRHRVHRDKADEIAKVIQAKIQSQ